MKKDTFESLYRVITEQFAGVDRAFIRENPMMTLRKIGNVTLEAEAMNAIPEKSNRFKKLFKAVEKQLGCFDENSPMDNTRLISRHIQNLVNAAQKLAAEG